VTSVKFFGTFVDVITGETVVSHAETIVASTVVTSSNIGTFCIGVTSSKKGPIVNSCIVDWITDQLWWPWIFVVVDAIKTFVVVCALFTDCFNIETVVTFAPVSTVDIFTFGELITIIETLGTFIDIIAWPFMIVPVSGSVVEAVPVGAGTIVCSNFILTWNWVLGAGIVWIDVAFVNITVSDLPIASIDTSWYKSVDFLSVAACYTFKLTIDTLCEVIASGFNDGGGDCVAKDSTTVASTQISHAKGHFRATTKCFVPHKLFLVVAGVDIKFPSVIHCSTDWKLANKTRYFFKLKISSVGTVDVSKASRRFFLNYTKPSAKTLTDSIHVATKVFFKISCDSNVLIVVRRVSQFSTSFGTLCLSIFKSYRLRTHTSGCSEVKVFFTELNSVVIIISVIILG
jgi:hypothetical protein